MNGLKCSVHFLTLKQIGYVESNTAVTFYHDRTHFDHTQRNQYAQYAEDFSLQQGRQFVLHNRIATTPNKMTKLKDQMKQLDSLLEKSDSIAKTIWLSPNRLLLITRDAVLTWLLIDPTSGDLIKILIDNKSLTNLSGTTVCDAALVIRSKPVLILAYSDKSVIDLISLSKTFTDHMKTWPTTQNLEKLSLFQPTITSFEFSCPNAYSIQKRISLNSDNNEFFSLWWPNDGQVANFDRTNPQQQQGFSLLERDDLRNNILLLSLNITTHDTNLLEHVFKSDGLLLSCSYLTSTSLVAVEQTETSNNKYALTIYRYDFPDHTPDQFRKSLKIKLNGFNLNARIHSTEQVKPSSKHILMLATDQTLVLYEKGRNIVRKHKLTSSINECLFDGVEWVLEDLIFCVYSSIKGQVCIFDVAFNQIDLSYQTRSLQAFKSLSEYLNPNILTPNNRLKRLVSARSVFKGQLWLEFNYSNGPFGLLKLCLPDKFSNVHLVSFYMKNLQSDATDEARWLTYAVRLIQVLDWEVEASQCLACLYRILSYVLSGRVVLNLRTQLLVEEALGSFYRPAQKLSEKTVYENKFQVSRWARKYFYQLVRSGSLSKAFLLAVDIGAKDLFDDLYYCALDRGENQVAEVCRKKYREIVSEENRVRLRNELNRSVTTVEEGVGALGGSYFDKCSVSSSEAGSVESEGEERGWEVCQEEMRIRMDGVGGGRLGNDSLKVLSEEDVQEYARKMVIENEFVYQLNFESFI